MGDSYWVRHSSLTGFVGPLTVEQLRAALAAGSLPADADVRKAKQGARAEVLDDLGWSKAHELVGVEAPPSDLPAPGAPRFRTEHVLGDVRIRSQYAAVRRVVTVLALVAAALAVAVELFVLATADRGRTPTISVLVTVAAALLQLAGIFVVHQVFQMLADLADCALRRETDAAKARVADAR